MVRHSTRHRVPSLCALALLCWSLAVPAPAVAEAGGNQHVLPGESCRGLFIVAMTVGRQDGRTLDMLLDTGASSTILDAGAIRELTGGAVTARKVLFRDARVGPHEIGRLRATVHSMASLSLALGRKIDGILGFPAFRDVLLTLDYPAGEVRVSSGRLPRPDGREVFRDSGRRRPFLKTDVGGRRVKMLLDSGATGGFLLRPEDRLEWTVEPRPVRASVLFSGVAVTEVGRLAGGFDFGPARFESPVVRVARRERLAGWAVLKNFVLTFDQRKKRIRMRFRGTDPVRMPSVVGAGLGFHPRSEGFEIVRIFPGSSAGEAGLREGDLVVAIDGVPVGKRGCRDPLGPAAGRREVLSYLRDGVRGESEIEYRVFVP